jgi:hypothetical protein
MSRRTRIARGMERTLLGAVMVVVTRIVERRILRAVRHKTSPIA